MFHINTIFGHWILEKDHHTGSKPDIGAEDDVGCVMVATALGVGIHFSRAATAFSNSGEAPTSISAVISPVDGRIFDKFPFAMVLVWRRASRLLKALLMVVLVAPIPAMTKDFENGISHSRFSIYNTHVDAETMISMTGAPDATEDTLWYGGMGAPGGGSFN